MKEKVVLPKLQVTKHFSITSNTWTSTSNHSWVYSTFYRLWLGTSVLLSRYCANLWRSYWPEYCTCFFSRSASELNLDPRKLVVTTTDNGRNYVAAFTTLERERVCGFGHNLNLVISKAVQIDRVQWAIWRCHALVELFSHSWKKCRDLRFKQEEFGLPKHKLIIACVYVCVCACMLVCVCVTKNLTTVMYLIAGCVYPLGFYILNGITYNEAVTRSLRSSCKW